MSTVATPTSSSPSQTKPRSVAYWSRTIAYWAFTGIVALEMVAGSMWDIFQIEYVRVVFAHLGYPLFMLYIIGIWKFPCAVALLVPRFPRLKEWAYAGAFFNYTGAALSHAWAGDGPGKWTSPIVFAILTLLSWALRPGERRVAPAVAGPPTRPLAWVASIATVLLMVVFAFVTLPR